MSLTYKKGAPEGACLARCRLPLRQQPSGAGGFGGARLRVLARSPAVYCLLSAVFNICCSGHWTMQRQLAKTRTPSPSVTPLSHHKVAVQKDNTPKEQRQALTRCSEIEPCGKANLLGAPLQIWLGRSLTLTFGGENLEDEPLRCPQRPLP